MLPLRVHRKGQCRVNEMEKLLRLLTDVNEDVDFANEAALVDDEKIDSFDILRIIAALDDAYGIHIDTGDIEPENFNSAESILELVQDYQKRK